MSQSAVDLSPDTASSLHVSPVAAPQKIGYGREKGFEALHESSAVNTVVMEHG